MSKQKRKTKKKVAERPSLGDFPDKANAALFVAKALLASHDLHQVGQGNVKYTVDKDGTFSLSWSAKFKHEVLDEEG